ncbi:T9SS type A sorting domain-containing protein [uncultured Polaribacter sp.]|uniref:T9SS type A sorting domain-containing protein n=1 Tax=uncultured Polaribacter sp. TaxID=174711 RepID=UPI00341F3EEA
MTSLNVYPNPAKENFTITLSNVSKANVIIYNTLGKIVYQDTINNGSVTIENNRKFTSGIYMVKVITSTNKVYHSKLIMK